MKRYNVYKIASGAYITDILDREAQQEVIRLFPNVPYWLTAEARTCFVRQWNGKSPIITEIQILDVADIKVYAEARILEKDTENLIALGVFQFVGKDKLAIKPRRKR